MPYRARLLQAIRDEDAKLLQRQAFHIIGPGAVVLIFIVLVGELAVRLVNAPEFFGGGMADIFGYGAIGVFVLVGITKGYVFDKWVGGWLHLTAVHELQVAKLKAVIERLENEGLAAAGPVAEGGGSSPQDDAWLRALRQPEPVENDPQ